MLGLVHELDMLGAVPPGDTDTVLPVARALVKRGYRPLFINAGDKTPAESRTKTDIRKAEKAAQELAKERGNENWQSVRAPGGGVHLAIETAAKVKGAYDRASERQPIIDGIRQPLNLALALNGERLLVVDCDTAESVAAFTDMARSWGINIHHPTVLSPGVQDADGSWKHSAGGHFYFIVPDEVSFADVPSFDHGKGVNAISFMTTTRYVLVPPSRRPEGSYRWIGGVNHMTDDMIQFVLGHEKKRRDYSKDRPKKSSVTTDTPADGTAADFDEVFDTAMAGTDIEDWAENNSWSDLLTARGWTPTGKTSACGCPEYTAPGEHASPKSATAHEAYCTEYTAYEGHAPLHVWTSNVPDELEDANRTLTKLQFIAAWDYDGDVAKAMKAQGIAIQDQTDYSDLIGWSGPTEQDEEQPAPVSAQPAIRTVNTENGPLIALGPAVGQHNVPTAVPSAVPPASPAPVPTLVPGPVPTSVPDQQQTQDDAAEVVTLPFGVEDMTDGDAGDEGRTDERPHAVYDTVRGVRMTDNEHATYTAMVESVTPYLATELTDSQRVSLARMVVRGEDPLDKSIYKRGPAYDPALMNAVFSKYDWTRSVWEHAITTADGSPGVANPVTSLVRELIRAANRVPVGMRTWRGGPLALYGLFLGESGKGKSYAMDTDRLSPWPLTEEYGFFKIQGESYPMPEEGPDYTYEPRSGQVIPKFFFETVTEDVVVGTTKDGDDKIEKRKLSKIKPHPSVVIEVDELSTLMALSTSDGATLVHTLDSAYSGRPIGGQKVGDAENTRITGKYRLQLLGGIQPSRFKEVMNHKGSGFPQRLLMVQVTWPWAGLDWELHGKRRPTVPTQAMTSLPTHGMFTVDDEIVRSLEHDGAVNAGVARERDVADAVATHLTDMRIRVACIGALLDGSLHVDKDMWEWAGAIIEVSRRSYLFAEVVAKEAMVEEAEGDGEYTAIVQSRAESVKVDNERKAFTRTCEYLAGHGPSTSTPLRRAMPRSVQPVSARLLDKWADDPSMPIMREKNPGKKGYIYFLSPGAVVAA